MAEIFSDTACRQLSQMFFAVLFFHSSEYVLAIAFHGSSNITLKSLLISKYYLLAMVLSIVEYLWWISNVGLAMVIIAGRAFTHLIKIYHEEHHQLVTHGVYSFVRHPGYCGFLSWSVGTQIMLCNPISTIGFAIIVQFFGPKYDEYAQRVLSGVPFVK
ncbi:hypothetical protein Patl1_10778 [Pistacia atlantica]|uniref:Uncharacterized protein n=1 Tax=Pistacia atlantica TaxID=434234 RepID=A0ACC1A648_9ROSI|nr:hypothetical protein Patl1_10778 [Pistacia atlantica]